MNDHIFWRDEVLQLMFWLSGEGIGEVHTAAEMARFLGTDEAPLRWHLAQMTEDGYLRETDRGYKLTEQGKAEGARRFREEFEPMVGQGHGECHDPDCDCHELGPEHCKSRVS